MRKKVFYVIAIWGITAIIVLLWYSKREVAPVKDFITWALSVWPILTAIGGVGVALTAWVIKHDFNSKKTKEHDRELEKKTTSPLEESKYYKLTDILTDMHERIWYLKSVRLRKRFDKQRFEDGAALLFDKLGLVKLENWDNFERRLGRRLRKRIPKSSEKRKGVIWRYKAVSEAKKIVHELVDSRQWQISDVVAIGVHLDSLDMGLGELRNKDKQWQSLSEKIKPYIVDPILRELIDKHISCSYAFCSMSLGIDYGNRLPKNSITRLFYSSLFESDISSNKMDVALGEILEMITIRTREIGKLGK